MGLEVAVCREAATGVFLFSFWGLLLCSLDFCAVISIFGEMLSSNCGWCPR